jgi:hypothetical protein
VFGMLHRSPYEGYKKSPIYHFWLFVIRIQHNVLILSAHPFITLKNWTKWILLEFQYLGQSLLAFFLPMLGGSHVFLSPMEFRF